MQPQGDTVTITGTIVEANVYTVNTRNGQRQKAVLDVLDAAGVTQKIQAWEGKDNLHIVGPSMKGQAVTILGTIRPASNPDYPPDISARAIVPQQGGMPQVQPTANAAVQQQYNPVTTQMQPAQAMAHHVDVSKERSQKQARGAAAKVAIIWNTADPPPKGMFESFFLTRAKKIATWIESDEWDQGSAPGVDPDTGDEIPF